jgi:hypothetical protein
MSENVAELVLAARWRRGRLLISPIDSVSQVSSWHFIEHLSVSDSSYSRFLALSSLSGSSFGRWGTPQSRKSSDNWTRGPRVYTGTLLKLFVYLLPFESYSAFSLWLETPLWRPNFKFFWVILPPKCRAIATQPLKSTTLQQTASFGPLEHVSPTRRTALDACRRNQKK